MGGGGLGRGRPCRPSTGLVVQLDLLIGGGGRGGGGEYLLFYIGGSRGVKGCFSVCRQTKC